MRVTDIKPQEKQRSRVSVFIDGAFAFGLFLSLLYENKIKVGQEITQATIENLTTQDQVGRLLNQALKFLSFRPRSEKEIRFYLLKKSDSKSEVEKESFSISIEKVVEKLKKIGQIDDESFANWWQDQRTRFKKMSPNLVKRELLAKGVSKEIIEKILNVDKEDEIDLARKAAIQKLKKGENIEDKETKLKISQFLARRGFSWDTIQKVVDTLNDEEVK